jgi:tetratricopeptide (TPR) repeat protein
VVPARPTDVTIVTEGPTVVESGPRSAPTDDERVFADGDRVVGRYRVEALLGQGGFGQVYQVADELGDGRPLALKLARLHDAGSRALGSLKSEFALLASLEHPNLAQVLDFGHVAAHTAYFTQCLAPGVPLSRTGLRPDDPAAVAIWTQLCRALEYLHGKGILHRDIKPSNILVDVAAGHLTLLDFGVSRALGAGDDRLLAGTFSYMPPEAISGAPLDARSDLYSLGVTLYRQLVGRVPFEGTHSQILSAHVAAVPDLPPLSTQNQGVAAVVHRLLAKDPGARFATAAEVAKALARANGVELEAEASESLASYVLSARFVGHDALVERLLALGLSVEPGAAAVVLTGEAGSGKSRLLREVRQRVQLAWRTFIEVEVRRTWLTKGVLPAIARAVINEDVAARLDDDDRRELSRALAELRRRGERIAVAVDPDRARQARIEALGRALALRFERAPGMLVVEDLHWADRDALALVAQLVRAARRCGARSAFVLATRPGQAAEELTELLDAERLCCDALSPEASSELVASMFGSSELLVGTELGKSLARGVHTAQAVQESLRLALDSGAVVRQGGEWRVVSPIAALPVGEVLGLRVARLDAESRQLALAVAVLGGEAVAASAAAVAEVAPGLAVAVLRRLVRAGVLEERYDREGRAAYAMHDRFRDVVLAGAPEVERGRVYRAAGRHLRATAARDHRALLEAADHFARARLPRLAIRSAAEAAKLAERSGRPDQAATAVALEIGWHRSLGDVPAQAWLRRFDLCHTAGIGDGAREALRALLDRLGDLTPRERVAAQVRAARLAMDRGDAEEARRTLDGVAAEASLLCDLRLSSELTSLMARVEEVYGQLDKAVLSFEAAAGLAEQAGDARLEARAWLGASLSSIFLGRAGQAGGYAERALRAARAAQDPVAMSESLRCLGNSARETGHLTRALKIYRRAVRAARDGGSPESEAKALNNLGTVCHWAGHIPEAVSALQRSLLLKERLGLSASVLLTKNNLGGIYLSLGRLDDAQAELSAVIQRAGTNEPMVVALAHSNSADLHVLRGELDTAIELYRVAHRMNRVRANAMADSHAVPGLLRALVMRGRPGDMEEAGGLSVTLEELHRESGLAETRTRYLTASAMLLDYRGEHEAALSVVRGGLDVGDDRGPAFSDPFGTLLEARWMEAVLLARLGRRAAAKRAAERARRDLMKTARLLGDESNVRVYLEQNPLHRAIVSGRLDTPPGFSWFVG